MSYSSHPYSMNPHLMKSNGAHMIRRSLMLVAALAVVSTSPVVAHEGHDHDEDLTDKQVAQIAAKALPSVIQSKKLSSAWSKAQRQDVTAESVSDKVVWVVSYKNPDREMIAALLHPRGRRNGC
jgi:hypothetical protein